MSEFPMLRTDRLLLRQFHLADANEVRRLAGIKEIARTTLVPHPYEEGVAEDWIEKQNKDFAKVTLINFAIVLAAKSSLIGSIGLMLNRQRNRGELGYWIGFPCWNKG